MALPLLILNGPNLNLLGTREPEIYGTTTHAELVELCRTWGGEVGADVDVVQSNHEGTLIDWLHDARQQAAGVVLNAGALTHSSYALHDAIVASELPTVEVHISNVREREPWRAISRIRPACVYSIYGRGIEGYRWALRHLVARSIAPPTELAYGPDPEQVGDLRIPAGGGRRPLVMLIHGGFWKDHWTRDLMDSVAVDLYRQGIASYNVEYRRIGSGGGWPHSALDIAAALETAAGLDSTDPERIAVVGHSAGGHLALWAGARESLTDGAGSDPAVLPAVTVGLAPVSDLAEAQELGLGGGATGAFLASAHEHTNVFRAASPIEMLPAGARMLIVHGTDDTDVPIGMSRAYAAAAEAAGDAVELVELAGAGHMDLIEPTHEAWATVRAFLDASL